MRELKQSTLANVMVFMADSTDHITGKTGLTLAVTLSKDGGAFASISPVITERTSGWYNIALAVSDTNTQGDLVVRGTSAGADASERALNVVANVEADTYARVGAPAGASIAADLLVIDNFVDDIEGRLTATRAGYLDNLSAGATALASACTETRLAELDAANLPTDVAAVKGDTAATLLDTGTDGVVVAAASKTGYSLTQTFPTNFSALSITAGGLADITQTAADKVWGTAARTLTSFGTLAADVWAVATRSLTDKEGFALSAAGVDAILDEVVEGTLTLRQIMRISLAALAGKSAGGGTATLTFKGADGTTTRITAAVDADGNRTAITVSGA